jgi:adenine-specific DNA-methyltransferase
MRQDGAMQSNVQADLLMLAERERVAALAALDPKRQNILGQYFTPAPAAALIASMPHLPRSGALRVLDPGAGTGMLSAALVARLLAESPLAEIHIVAVECDTSVLPHLLATLTLCRDMGAGRVSFDIVDADYIHAAAGLAVDERLVGFDLAIQNPPYSKLAASSTARTAARSAGIDAPNLYAAFLGLATAALNPGGQLVAITPRSFCNGPYFSAFRSYLLDQIALDRVHVFESRSTVFADTGVLQENVIIAGTKHGRREVVLLSSSNGHEDDAARRRVTYGEVVRPDDPHRFIRIAANGEDADVAERMMAVPQTLASLGISVSTGRVVDFRSRECLHRTDVEGGLPLVYPGNLRRGAVAWPSDIRKPQWFKPVGAQDRKLLVPEGWYCVVKRFSAKEERRRIVSAVWSPEEAPGPVAFENHLNFFHAGGRGLDREVAYGISMWLNSTLVDRYFRMFSGHTQVNATDLRTLRFPDLKILCRLGSMTPDRSMDQAEIDAKVRLALGEIGVCV